MGGALRCRLIFQEMGIISTQPPPSSTKQFLIHAQRFAEVHALQQALLRTPATKEAAMAIDALCPPKTSSSSFWSSLFGQPGSDTCEATTRRRAEAIPAYLEAVLNDDAVRVWLLDMGE